MFRKIIVPESNQLIVNIPDEFIGHYVEVIAFLIEAFKEKNETNTVFHQKNSMNDNKSQHFDKLFQFIKENPIKLPDNFKFNREELYE
ncbi:MAG: hypothetical protein HY738_20380 [Bacteroidia bacterium]|nr:hypothetical protein [Bacteroidia bacterium]